jgi:hypothetical protein
MAADIKELRKELKSLKETKAVSDSDVDDMYFGGTGLSDKINSGEARHIAAAWHGGKSHPSYAFASSGHFSPELVHELEGAHHQTRLAGNQEPDDAEQLSSLVAYAKGRLAHEQSKGMHKDVDENVDPLSMDNLLVEKMNIKTQMEGLDDKSKAVIQKLLNAAENIRNGKAALVDDIETPAAPARTNSMLTESAPSGPVKIPAVSLDSLHNMLLRTTKALNSNKSNLKLESLANNISTLIAEGLMNNKINSTALLNETVISFKGLVK